MKRAADRSLPPPHAPKWALEAGLPEPDPGQSFNSYCRDLGIPAAKIREFREGLKSPLALDLVNARFGSYLVEVAPRTFAAAVERWSKKRYT